MRVFCCTSGSTGGDGSGSVGQREGGGGGQAGGPAGQERERGAEESNQERETETQDNMQGLRNLALYLASHKLLIVNLNNEKKVDLHTQCGHHMPIRSIQEESD